MEQIFTKLFKKNKVFTFYGTIITYGNERIERDNTIVRFDDNGDNKYTRGGLCYILPFKAKVGKRVKITFELL